MYFPYLPWYVVCVITILAAVATGKDAVYKDEKIEIIFFPFNDIYDLGAPIPLQFRITNLRGSAIGLMNHYGAPVPLRFEVKDAGGKNVLEKIVDGPRLDPKPEEWYKWNIGEAVEFDCDMSQLFQFKSSGEYTIIATWDLAVILEVPIRIVDMKQLSNHDVFAHGAALETYPKYFEVGGRVPIQCRLQASAPSESSKLKSKSTLFRINEYSVDGKVPFPIDLRHWEERETVVQDMELDYLWQLWTSLKSGKQMSLLVWNLREGRVRTVIPWGHYNVEMGSTWATRTSRTGKVVIAGVSDTVKPSTSTVNDYVFKAKKE